MQVFFPTGIYLTIFLLILVGFCDDSLGLNVAQSLEWPPCTVNDFWHHLGSSSEMILDNCLVFSVILPVAFDKQNVLLCSFFLWMLKVVLQKRW